ncbi:orotidine 5'-phosphate decarboxylase [Anaerosporomusa subterranea]|uniref:Orotidine 5'-phosphate decarboxylase n=1 Tax=Anaerosporomusa subterranea TaxID=1794912 RepID=A0A154BV52_ANASB|nr:orotidine-5'-phosphate decarboxylase [Anaerosporomusa subterranea]KYZ77368.1 orotidine 5'-phosphate decarboxylase [Anaerosporomusa subterranea]
MSRSADIIVALDVTSIADVKRLVEELGDSVNTYKVGMELFYSAGPEAVHMVRSAGKNVFLDLKLHDIPNTVAQGAKALTSLGADFISIHATGGSNMMRETARIVGTAAASQGLTRPKLLAITVLTSIGQTEWQELRFPGDIGDQVVHLAKLAQQAGIDGVVASPQEAGNIRRACGDNFLIVTPGVRPAGSAINDQSRIATPSGAVKAGANYLVIGRPITASANPRAATEAIRQEMEACS